MEIIPTTIKLLKEFSEKLQKINAIFIYKKWNKKYI